MSCDKVERQDDLETAGIWNSYFSALFVCLGIKFQFWIFKLLKLLHVDQDKKHAISILGNYSKKTQLVDIKYFFVRKLVIPSKDYDFKLLYKCKKYRIMVRGGDC
jgi:hypothetical protein